MQRPRWLTATAAIGAIAMAATLAGTTGAVAQAGSTGRHVLVISVDGLHASDMARWVGEHRASSLAALSGAGTTYANASASEPSDSFPGLLAPLTGGAPKSHGVYYDDAYARELWAPGTTTCSPSTRGTEAQYAENIDKVDAAGFKRINAQIDPALEPVGGPDCQPVAPPPYLRTNPIFNVARDAGLPTAWSDKHPAYDLVNGHPGRGVVDLYTPDINMDVNTETVNAAGYALNTDGSQSRLKLPEPELQITDSVANTEAYDQLKV